VLAQFGFCCCLALLAAGTMVVALLQGVHNQWQDPSVYRPERFMPGGEYDQFDEAVRPYMFVPFIQVGPAPTPFLNLL
jgi:hypothetical protein